MIPTQRVSDGEFFGLKIYNYVIRNGLVVSDVKEMQKELDLTDKQLAVGLDYCHKNDLLEIEGKS